uniref:Uncharacterized protein n=1 Tax=Cucumis sativus TaxID=3659 RepID=A0A0A0L6E8_CUCSA
MKKVKRILTARTTRASFPACGSSVITSSDLRELADRSGDAPSSMSEPFRNWLGMGPRDQPESSQRESPPPKKVCLFPLGICEVRPQKRKEQCILLSRPSLEWECSVAHGARLELSGSLNGTPTGLLSAAKLICPRSGESQVPERLARDLNCLSCAREGPPVPRQHLEVHFDVLDETRDIPHSMAWHLSLIHSARPDAEPFFHYHLPPLYLMRENS